MTKILMLSMCLGMLATEVKETNTDTEYACEPVIEIYF